MYELYCMILTTATILHLDGEQTAEAVTDRSTIRADSLASFKGAVTSISTRKASARISLYICSLFLLGLMISECIVSSREASEPKSFQYLTMLLFTVAALFYLISLSLLICIIQRNFREELGRERIHLMLCQTVFVTTFIIRVCMLFFEGQGGWVNFSRDYPSPNYVRMIPFQFAIYDLAPYMTMISLHWINFRTKPEDGTPEVDKVDLTPKV